MAPGSRAACFSACRMPPATEAAMLEECGFLRLQSDI